MWFCGMVLMWPMEYSHWTNLNTILDELAQRGHEVTVLVSSASILVDPNKQSVLNFEVYLTAFTENELHLLFMKWTKMWSYELPKSIFWAFIFFYFLLKYTSSITLCEDAILTKNLTKKLQESKFDVLGDAVSPYGELMSELLNLLWSIVFDSLLAIHMKNSVEGLHYLLPM
ncbi:hypothetical protein HPG69_001432 [Diceros bicornis minor]|uniref:Uncharacterized protein n=1 Tax=Diceros bicornis minor TaxID=77932 RepID=A0A7J7FFF3_DICBM|nr:hypothetical protein HPG69_001432 [Diceros bicornis minor]